MDLSLEAIYGDAYFQGGRPDGYSDYVGSEDVLRGEFRGVVRELRVAGCKTGRLLEIGCAYGFFLAEAAPYFDVHGIEMSGGAVEFCRARGFDVELGELQDDYIVQRPPFDVVVMLDVIEHLREPDEVVRRIHRAMKPGGRLLLSTGDWSSALSRIMGRRWRLMTPPQHTFFFSPRTMSAMLTRLGFEVIGCRRPWKAVPLGLAVYQFGRILGMNNPPCLGGSRFGVPINLFDAFRMIAIRR